MIFKKLAGKEHNCENCGKKLSFISWGDLCKDCKKKNEAEYENLEKNITQLESFDDQKLEYLNKFGSESLNKLYNTYYASIANRNLDENDIEKLNKLQKSFGLTNKQVNYDERIRPVVYSNFLLKNGTLPTIDIASSLETHVILQKGEIAHFVADSTVNEIKTISLGYKGGSHGISIPIGLGLRYRIGSHKGHIEKEDRLLETSRGNLIITNSRFFLHPIPGNKPLSIPINKILSFHCSENMIEIFKDGREKGYYIKTDPGSVKIVNLCLEHLTQ